MAGIAVAIAGVVGITSASVGATAFGVITGVISAGLSFGLSYGLNALTTELFGDKPQVSAGTTGAQITLQQGGDVPRQIPMGRVGVQGQSVYWNSYGESHRYFQRVFVLGDWECDGLDAVTVYGKKRTLSSQSVGGNEDALYHVSDFSDKIKVRFFSGKPGQGHDAELVNNSNPSGRLTSSDVGTGLCYVSVTLEWDQALFQQGLPEFIWHLRGAKLYDWRKDSSAGGTGAHRWNDPSTWEFSENPAVMLYNYRRGFYQASERIAGQGYGIYDLNQAMFTAAANVCDEQISEGGSAVARYRASIIASDSNDHAVVLSALAEAMGGYNYTRQGVAGVIAGAAQTSVATIKHEDLVTGAPKVFTDKRPGSTLANGVYGQFLNPENNWQLDSYPPFTSAAYEAADGNERKIINLDFKQVTSVYQARRLRDIRLNELRYQRSLQITLPYKWMRLDAGDWVTWQDDLGTWTARIDERIRNKDRTITLLLQEVAADIYTAPAGTITLNPGTSPADPSSATIGAPTNLDVSVINQDTLRLTWDAPDPLPVGFAGYRLRVGSALSTWASATDLIPGLHPATHLNIPLLAEGTYRFHVRSETIRELQSASAVYNKTIALTPQPPIISALRPFMDAIEVVWVNPSDETFLTYELYVYTSSGTPVAADLVEADRSEPGKVKRHMVGGLDAGTTYYVRMRSVNYHGTPGVYTAEQSVETGVGVDDVPSKTALEAHQHGVESGQIRQTVQNMLEQIGEYERRVANFTDEQGQFELVISQQESEARSEVEARQAAIASVEDRVATSEDAITLLTSNDEARATSISLLSARVGANAGQFNHRLNVVVTDLETEVTDRTTITSAHDGRISTVETSASTLTTQMGVTQARKSFYLNADGHIAGLSLLSQSDAGSTPISGAYFLVDVLSVAQPGVNGGNPRQLILVDGSSFKINTDLIVDGQITAAKLNVTTLSSIAADVGTITAGVLRSSDSKFVIDLDNKTLTISS